MACVRVLNRALFLFFHDHVAAVIQLSFMPKGAVRQVMFARGGAHRHFLGKGFVMGSSFIPARFRRLSFRIWHNLEILIDYDWLFFNFFRASQRGSISFFSPER